MQQFRNRLASWLSAIFAAALLASGAASAADIPPGTPPEPEEEAAAVDIASLPAEIILRDYLVIGQVGTYGRTPLHIDRIEAELASGDWKLPKAGDTLTSPQGTILKWEPALAEPDGTLAHAALRGGYALITVDSAAERVMLLEAQGHGTCWVNGEPRAGDPYQSGRLVLPVALKQGQNTLLFHVGAGQLVARLTAPQDGDLIDLRDNTLPDLVAGEAGTWHGSVLVVNASTEPLEDIFFEANLPNEEVQIAQRVTLAPLFAGKVPFRLKGAAPGDREKVEVELRLRQGRDAAARQLDAVKVALEIKQPGQLHQRTFISGIDGSVQPYAILPAKAPNGASEKNSDKPGVILALHGTAIEPRDEAARYKPLEWAHIVAPMNRRPYGFDWEDFGRIDALEALAAAQTQFPADPRRVLLAGEAMGGHGCLHLGTLYPDRFAAIAPLGAWISFWTYGGVPQPPGSSKLQELLSRATSASDTLKVVRNLHEPAIFLRHAEDDEVVPVAQARTMRSELAQFHTNFAYQELAASKAASEEIAAAPEVLAYLRQQQTPLPQDVRQLSFSTSNPGVSSTLHWLAIEAQQSQFEPSEVKLNYEPGNRHFLGTTKNVARLSLDLSHLEPKQAITVTLDGQKLGPLPWPPGTPRVWFSRSERRWQVTTQAPYAQKGPHRYGLLKDAFRNRVLFVYGTKGTPEENAWSLAKARYDAETFGYRGNAAVEIVADRNFDPGSDQDRNVVLYGNASSNGAWPALLSLSPIQVRRGQVNIGARPEIGEDVACVFVRPRPGGNTATVAVVGGTGLAGMRATNRLRYFVSGIAYPDLLIFGAEALAKGEDEVRMLGYFGLNWSLDEGEFYWRDLAL